MKLADVMAPSRLLALMAFVLATVSLSHVLAGLRQLFALGANCPWDVWSPLLYWTPLLVVMVLALLFRSYQASQREGKVVHTVWLFEQVSQWMSREKRVL